MSPSRDGRSRDPRRPSPSGRPGRGPAPKDGRQARPRSSGTGQPPRRPSRQAPPRPRPTRTSASAGPRRGGGPTGPGAPPRRRFRLVNPRRRIKVSLVMMVGIMLVFAGRLVQIQGIDADGYAAAAAEQRRTTIDIPTTRGAITDINGKSFAMSVESRLVFVDPTEIRDDERDKLIRELSERFGLDTDRVAAKVNATPSRYQVIKKNVAPKEWKDLAERGFQGLGALVDYKRVYPDETGAADVIGFTNAAGQGAEGLEAVLDTTLAGEAGKQQVDISASGTQIPMGGGLAKDPVPGKDARLTLDQDVQWHAEQALAARSDELDAGGGSVIVMRPNGEIVAMADYPTYSPRDINSSTAEERLNGAVAEAFEPGSTNKVITVAGALEEGLTTPDTVYTVPYSIQRYDRTFKDDHFHDTERMTLSGILAKSSNVGTIQVGEQLGKQRMYDYLRKFGFGQPTGLDLPGENAGILTDPKDWWGTQLPSISFGQGLSVNAMQMASVYATVANDGVRVEPHLLAGTVDKKGEFTPAPEHKKERIVSKATADELKLMLEAVTTDEGTAATAQVPGYRVAGKTGTANRVDPETGTYKGGGHTSSFVGFAPADDPQLIVQVVLHNPKKEYYAGKAAAPVFTDVMSFALKSLKIEPTGTEAPNIRLMEDE
ncbi:peptidoglycan glycosyltransferase [Nocardiopsis gilva YIM 90087]|uniref:Peptidoglycan glycosyltransferase n=2 Tax=Nocardiopsis gilva TaxID=280236 RepID=A0A223S5K1_9ACTN|nr:penicillin-binding protein 2 [Nocardiopsis gilva]ASU83416.1 peptidoglycan glycosyltransferase [Nocardiopsis gilva YIM 90087]